MSNFKNRREKFVLWSLYGVGVLFVLVEFAALSASSFGPIAAGLSLLMFCSGMIAMAIGLLIAIQLSRYKLISVADIFLLSQGVPRARRARMLLVLTVESLLGIGAAIADPTGGVVFGVLAPIHALGFIGLWAAMFGEFADRDGE